MRCPIRKSVGNAVVAHSRCYFRSEAECVVPKSIELYDIARSRRYRLSVFGSVHPSGSYRSTAGIEQTVVVNEEVGVFLFFDEIYYFQHKPAILCRSLLYGGIYGILLNIPHKPQRTVGDVRLYVVGRIVVAAYVVCCHFGHRGKHTLEPVDIADAEGRSGQRQQCVAHPEGKPRVTGNNIEVAVLFDKKLFGCVYEAVLERVVRLGLFQLTVEEAFYRSGVNVFCACREHYRLAALHRQLEVSGSEQILFVV